MFGIRNTLNSAGSLIFGSSLMTRFSIAGLAVLGISALFYRLCYRAAPPSSSESPNSTIRAHSIDAAEELHSPVSEELNTSSPLTIPEEFEPILYEERSPLQTPRDSEGESVSEEGYNPDSEDSSILPETHEVSTSPHSLEESSTPYLSLSRLITPTSSSDSDEGSVTSSDYDDCETKNLDERKPTLASLAKKTTRAMIATFDPSVRRRILPGIEEEDRRSSDYGVHLLATIGPWHRMHPILEGLDRIHSPIRENPVANYPVLNAIRWGIKKVWESSDEAPFTQLLLNASTVYNKKRGNDPIIYFTQPMLTAAAAILSRQLPMDDGTLSFGSLIQEDRRTIDKTKITPKDYAGTALVTSRKLGAKANIFNPFTYNFPFSVGIRLVNRKPLCILRHAVPTIEEGSVSILPQYTKFIGKCQKEGKKILYCCLLNPHEADESKRIDALMPLSIGYPNTFHFIRFPLDGKLTKNLSHFEGTLENYAGVITEEITKSLLGTSHTFIFSDAVKRVVQENHEAVLRFAKTHITSVYKENSNCDEAQKALLMLFSTTLRTKVLSELGIDYYNNSCKDAIDRGAAHLLSDLLFDSLLTGTLKTNRAPMRIATSFPAFMAKTQGILKGRAAYIEAFSNFCDKMSRQELVAFRDSLASELGIGVDPLEFNLDDLCS